MNRLLTSSVSQRDLFSPFCGISPPLWSSTTPPLVWYYRHSASFRFLFVVTRPCSRADENLLFLMAHDTDSFNKWEACNTYYSRLILSLAEKIDSSSSAAAEDLVPAKFIDAIRIILQSAEACTFVLFLLLLRRHNLLLILLYLQLLHLSVDSLCRMLARTSPSRHIPCNCPM